MKIGIFVYSQTGNTLCVAEKLRAALEQKGYAATIERILTVGDVPKDFTNIRFEKMPDMRKYEGIVLASPVQAFSLNPVMAAWLAQLPAISGKKIACFVTKKMGGNWSGGTKAIATITKAVKEKGSSMAGSAIVHWGKQDAETPAAVEKLCSLF